MSSTKRKTLPRRTQEFDIVAPQSSVKKPQARVSRIAQPVRKSNKPSSIGLGQFGENGRSRSVERGINGTSLGGVQSSASKKSLNPRSSSATPQLRTPLRSVGCYAAGLNAENIPPFTIPSTVERERCTAEARQIFDYLAQANVPDLPKEFVERASLKAMSMKQFLIIVAHLLRQIGGTRYKIGANFIEDIMRSITELQCPFTVNKSMLKTPSAPHSIHQVTMVLAWLIQLAPPPIAGCEWAPNYQHASEFPSPDYTQFFFQSAIESFHLWNLKREEEFGAQVEAMVDRLVGDRTGGLTQAELRDRVDKIRAQLEIIDSDQSSGQPREQSFDGVQRMVLEQQRLEKQLVEEMKQLSKQLEAAEHEHYQRQDQYYDCENAIQKLKEQLSRQQMTVKERDELHALIAHNKNLIGARRNEIVSLEDELSDYQISLSRLIKQKINLTSELNTKLYNFSSALKPDIQFTPIELSLTAGNYPELQQTLLALDQQLTELFQQYRELCLRFDREKFTLEQRVSDLQLTITPLETKVAKQKERLQHVQQQLETIGRSLAALEERAHENETRKDRAKQLDQLLEQVREQLVSNQKGIEKLTHDKHQLMEEGLERCRQALVVRHRKLDNLRTYVEGCESIMQQLVNVCSRGTEEKENENNCS
uniref:Kinetochore protein NDC80 n=1 Tax=Anopheles dirus TaxID=7168 RepID=A0A182N975_9DIPT